MKELKGKAYLYHIGFWLGIYLLWVAVFRSYSITIYKTMTIEFCYLIFITADFYAINNLIVPHFLQKKRYIYFIISTIFIIALSAWLRALVSVQMNSTFFHAPPIDFTTLVLKSTFNITLWVLLITIGKMLVDRIQTQQQLELLEKEKIESELNYLKAQINPHSLFNSLNTIYGHIDKSNQTARNILLQFSELLRYQLYDCNAGKVNLDREIDYIKNYVAFQRLRKDEDLMVTLDMENIEAGFTIAPLLLVVLIENAFKFVSSFPEKENRIAIRIFTKNRVLYSTCSNTKEKGANTLMATNAGGIGITNLKRRLELLYPKKYQFETRIEDEHYEAILNIDLL